MRMRWCVATTCVLASGLVGCVRPTLTITYVPAYGDRNGMLKGHVDGPLPYWAYAITTHLEVGGQYWGKPYAGALLTYPRPDGTFDVDVTTGGVDRLATRIVVCVVPAHYKPDLHRPPAPRDTLARAVVERPAAETKEPT